MMNIVYCPFCDREFSNSTKYRFDIEEELRLHVIEHHHVSEETYHEIRKALELKYSMNEICNKMKEAIKIFSEEIDSIARDEIVNRLFPSYIIENE